MYVIHVYKPTVPVKEQLEEEAKNKLSQVKVAILYQRVTDGVYYLNRSVDDVINILKETKTDFIFRGWWRKHPCPESPDTQSDFFPPEYIEESVRRGYTYEHLRNAIAKIKKEMPDVIFCGAVSCQWVNRKERDPITGETFDIDRTWAMALDPGKWNISMSKEEFQERFARGLKWIGPDEEYDRTKVWAYFPDITNPDFQKLILDLAKKQIDCGADAIWIDYLFNQAQYLAKITKDPYHPAVRESLEAASKIVDEIHSYGYSKGKYIYVGSWASFVDFPYPPPDLDFVTPTLSSAEVYSMEIDEDYWNVRIKKIREKLGDIPIFAHMDLGSESLPLTVFAQNLSTNEQKQFLEYADNFFQKKGINFIYPVHGGWFGKNPKILAFGKFNIYDSLAPEFDTYDTIKELAQNKIFKIRVETICDDRIDNDGDGLIDNEDGDCWIREGVIYETHPYYYPNHSFKEITQQIPKLADLGVKTICLMPIWEHAGDGPPHRFIYAINDYYKIDPAYGTPEDLKELVDTAHQYNLKVILDFVTCCAPEGSVAWNNNFPFMISLSELQKKAKELGWELEYGVRGGDKIVYYNCEEKEHVEKYITCEVCGKIIGENVVIANYPVASWGWAIDRTNPEVIDYFTKVAEYYTKEYDIDGWRVDAPQNNWNPNVISGDHSAIRLLRNVKRAITEVKPNAILLAEVPAPSPGGVPEFDEMCEASCSHLGLQFLIERWTPEDLVTYLKNEKIQYGRARVRFMEGHGTPRINKLLEQQGKPQLMKPLLVLISTLPGIPMIQAGQEIGETKGYNENPRVDWINGDYELREFYKKVFKIRNSNNALKYGTIENVWKSGDNIYAYLRKYENESVIVMVNFLNKQATSILNLSFLPKGTILHDELNNETFIVNAPRNFRISVPAYGSRILVATALKGSYIEVLDGNPTLFVGEKPLDILGLRTTSDPYKSDEEYQNVIEYINKAAKYGYNYVAVKLSWHRMDTTKHNTFPKPEDVGKLMDWKKLDEIFDYAKSKNVYIIPFFWHNVPPQWWFDLTPNYKDFLQTSDAGKTVPMMSFNVPGFQKYEDEAIKAIINRYKNHPAYLGFLLQFGYSNEDNYPGAPYLKGWFDYSPFAKQRFREWLKEKYHHSVSSLQEAWGNSSVNFENAEPPKPLPEITNSTEMIEWINGGGDSRRQFYDWQLFRLEEKRKARNHLIDVVKSADPNHVLIMTSPSVGGGLLFINSMALNYDEYSSSKVDIVHFNPGIYKVWLAVDEADKYAFVKYFETRGKAAFIKWESRKSLAPDNVEELKKRAIFARKTGSGMALWENKIMNFPEFADEQIKIAAETFRSTPEGRLKKSKFAIIDDTFSKSFDYRKGNGNLKMYSHFKLADRAMLRGLLYSAGLDFDIITTNEILSNPDILKDYKAVVLSNLYRMNDELLEILVDYRNAGGGLFIQGRTGLYDEYGRREINYLKQLLGINSTIQEYKAIHYSWTYSNADEPLLKGISGRQGGKKSKYNVYYLPVFDYEREGYKVLGHLNENPEIATIGYKGKVVFWFPRLGMKVVDLNEEELETTKQFLRNLYDFYNIQNIFITSKISKKYEQKNLNHDRNLNNCSYLIW